MTTWQEQYEALGSQAVYFADWPHHALVLTGGDRVSFLNNLCTADIRRLTPNESCEAFITNVKGHVLAHALVSCSAESLVVIVLQRHAESMATHLDRYIIREDVQVRSDGSSRVLVVGQAGKTLAAEGRGEGTEVDWRSEPFPLLHQPAWLAETPATARQLTGLLEQHGLTAGDPLLFEALRIESGWPLAGVDFGEGTLPQELDRNEQAISFTKGCYLGQETVARLDALGHVNKSLVGVKGAGDAKLTPGMQLFAGEKQVGQITSATYSPALAAPLGLALVRRGSNAPGTRLKMESGEAEVVALPVR